jgi:hypothetical protein
MNDEQFLKKYSRVVQHILALDDRLERVRKRMMAKGLTNVPMASKKEYLALKKEVDGFKKDLNIIRLDLDRIKGR